MLALFPPINDTLNRINKLIVATLFLSVPFEIVARAYFGTSSGSWSRHPYFSVSLQSISLLVVMGGGRVGIYWNGKHDIVTSITAAGVGEGVAGTRMVVSRYGDSIGCDPIRYESTERGGKLISVIFAECIECRRRQHPTPSLDVLNIPAVSKRFIYLSVKSTL